MRNPHARSEEAKNCDSLGVELFRQLRERVGEAATSSAGDCDQAWPHEALETMNATELRAVLNAFRSAVRADLAGRATSR
jgi:hypothetical protein